MRRIQQLVVVAIVALAPFALALPASAVGTCAIGYTGPDSNNQCISKTTYTCTVKNNNNVDIVNTNDQSATSGTVIDSSNTGSGNTVSGQVSNTNGTVFNVSITNSGEVSSCTAVAIIPATGTPVTPVTPVQPLAAGVAVATLPHTSGDSFGPILAVVLTVLGAGAGATLLGAQLYRRLNS